jgi:hypothetical protein
MIVSVRVLSQEWLLVSVLLSWSTEVSLQALRLVLAQ